MDGGITVFGYDTLRDEDGVFKVVTIPRHESHQHVLTQSEFAQVCGCTVSDHIAFSEFVATLNDGTLVNIGVLVRTLVFDEVVNIHTNLTGLGFSIVHTYHDTGSVNIVNNTATQCSDHGTGVNRSNALNTCSHKSFFWTQDRHSLALHIGAHQSAVGVIVLKEGHQRSGHRDDLCWRDVHVLNALFATQNRFALFPRRHQVANQAVILAQHGVRLRDHVFGFFDG